MKAELIPVEELSRFSQDIANVAEQINTIGVKAAGIQVGTDTYGFFGRPLAHALEDLYKIVGHGSQMCGTIVHDLSENLRTYLKKVTEADHL